MDDHTLVQITAGNAWEPWWLGKEAATLELGAAGTRLVAELEDGGAAGRQRGGSELRRTDIAPQHCTSAHVPAPLVTRRDSTASM